MELLQLRYFVTVARTENITKAAQEYSIPQPAMSQTIARLERELGGVRLFDRKNGRIFLNEQGRTFLRYAEKALQSIDDGVQALKSSEDHISGSIRILAIENRRFVFGCITEFSEMYPDVSFFVSHDYHDDRDGEFDLCISSMQYHGQMHSCTPLIKENIVLAIHESNPLASKQMLQVGDLKNQVFITLPAHSALHSITYSLCRSCGFTPQVRYICDDPYFVRKYIFENMGVAFAPEVSWAGRFRENTRIIPLKEKTTTTSYLLLDENRYLSPACALFREFLLKKARELKGNLL
ncbi:MAG: LysR family transcriptional regulator [Clostridia bacterium]|nr:LysR family transcriptional regulator [Clostridia bacterium]